MRQKSPIWHPITQHALSSPEVFIEGGEGAYLSARGGRKILDAVSSWWVITHGHCHPKIVSAVKEQAEKLDQVIFAGFTHEPAEKLARKILSLTDPALEYVFYSDSGSTAVEAALKMAIGYFEHTGNPKRTIVALEGGYHGDTFGAMSASGRGVFNKLYEPYLFDVQHLPFPAPDMAQKTIQEFEKILRAGDVAALILEPLVQGAAGMKIYSAEILKALADLCREYDALLIADEVMTGFGRTGTRFACEQAGVTPDIMCLSKGLTGGFLPMGMTLATGRIYDAFYQDDKSKMFLHSTSFTGNPLSCAAALANLEIWEEEPVLERIHHISKIHRHAARWFGARSDVANVRTLGTIFALEIHEAESDYLSGIGPVLYEYYMEQGVLLRPLGNTVYILPPYCVTQTELDRIYDTLWRSLDMLRDEGLKQAA